MVKETEAFETRKDTLIYPPVLTLPRLGYRLTIDTDAGDMQVCYVLLPYQPDENDPKTIGYWSRSLTATEKNYDTTQKECVVVVWAVLNLRPYLEGTQFTIRTDLYAVK